MNPILDCQNLTKYYGNKIALDNLNLTLEPGKIIGLLGPNGSGKTTFIKLLNGLLTPDKGQVLINGMKPGIDTKKIVSYLPERTYLGSWRKSAISLISSMISMRTLIKAGPMICCRS